MKNKNLFTSGQVLLDISPAPESIGSVVNRLAIQPIFMHEELRGSNEGFYGNLLLV
jgi:hypothetical protein